MRVAVMAADPLIRKGAAAYLLTCPGVSSVPPDALGRADVVVVIAGQVGEEALALMRHAADAPAAGTVPIRSDCWLTSACISWADSLVRCAQ